MFLDYFNLKIKDNNISNFNWYIGHVYLRNYCPCYFFVRYKFVFRQWHYSKIVAKLFKYIFKRLFKLRGQQNGRKL